MRRVDTAELWTKTSGSLRSRVLRTKALGCSAHDGHRRADARRRKWIKQINEFIDWPALVEKLSPADREVYEAMKSECEALMNSPTPDHEKISQLIRDAQEFLIT